MKPNIKIIRGPKSVHVFKNNIKVASIAYKGRIPMEVYLEVKRLYRVIGVYCASKTWY